jgi:hypothetical protein
VSVRGSLDRPPIVIRSAWWKIILRYAAIAALIGAALYSAEDDVQVSDDVGMFIVLFVFVFCVAIFLHAFLRSRIELSPSGIVYATLTRKKACVWQDVTSVYLIRTWSPHIATTCIRLSEEPARNAARALPTAVLNQIPGSGWPMSAQELADLVIAARMRWG